MPPNKAKQDSGANESGSALSNLIASLCGPILLALALWFLLGASKNAPVPPAQTPAIQASDIDPTPRFAMMSDPPSAVIGGIAQRCNDCHGLVDLSRNDGQPLVQHSNIKLNHGLNDRCLSCHDREDRNRLVGRHGENLAYADVAELCSQCHGPVFNDWTNGTHGKTLGYWDSTQGDSRKLTCTECHDPHSPAYQPMRPLPGPNTLRMGKQDAEFAAHISEERNPLLRWRLDESNGGHHGNGHNQDTTDGGAH
jgi:hypothetical protein